MAHGSPIVGNGPGPDSHAQNPGPLHRNHHPAKVITVQGEEKGYIQPSSQSPLGPLECDGRGLIIKTHSTAILPMPPIPVQPPNNIHFLSPRQLSS